jgi:hypothetical protein
VNTDCFQGLCTYCAQQQLEWVPGTGKACVACNMKKVRYSYLGVKKSSEIIISSKEEGVTPRLKKAKTLGIVPKAGPVSVMIGKLAEGSAEVLDAIWQQNVLLNELLVFEEQLCCLNGLIP